MVGNYGAHVRQDHPLERTAGRRSWMPLYLAVFLLSVVIVEMIGHHLLAS